MHCDDVELKFQSSSHFSELDSALHELGMLSTYTEARREYLSETKNRDLLNMLTINTRYKPYSVFKREERLRTKSENNDSNDSSGTSLVQAILEDTIKSFDDLAQLKKAKSLESIVGENTDVDFSAVRLPEVEIVSNCIEKLKVE